MPGHSPSDTLLLDRDNRILFTGDHLISGISSNALVTRPQDGADKSQPHPLLDYRRSLQATRALDVELALGGHGEPITDHRGLIDRRLQQQTERADRILALVRAEPRSAHELANEIWGDIAFSQTYLTISEVLGHQICSSRTAPSSKMTRGR